MVGSQRSMICDHEQIPVPGPEVAYDAACQALTAHRHCFSPKKFTQPQLLAFLVLKESGFPS